MSNDDAKGPKFVVGAGAAAVGAAVAAPLAVLAPVSSAALAAVATATFDMAGAAFLSYRERRAKEWWEAFVGNLGTKTAEGAVTEATLRSQSDTQFQQLVYHALSAVWSAVDEAVIPLLAFLAADYQARGHPADALYKRLARFLQEISGEELEMARALLTEVQAEMASTSKSARTQDREARSDGVPIVAQRAGTRVTIGGNRQVSLGKGCAFLIQRLESEQLVDGSSVIGDYAAVFMIGPQLQLLQRYLARPFI